MNVTWSRQVVREEAREFRQRFLAEIAAAVEIIAAGLVAGGKVAFVRRDVARQAARDRPNRAGIERVEQCGVRHQPRDAAVAVEERVYPRQSVMRGRGRKNGLGLAEAAIDLLEAREETRDGRRADGDMAADLDIAACAVRPG